MKFCNQCENMLYIKINQENENHLNYYCRNCGYEDTSLTEECVCVLDTQIKKTQQKFDHIINPYTKMDPTLPRIYNMKCPNGECKTNKKGDDEDENITSEIIYIRYDDDELKYVYICPNCDTNWVS